MASHPDAVQATRSFHRPTGLEPGELVMLRISDLPRIVRVELNQMELTPRLVTASDWQADATSLLAPRNQLALTLAINDQAAVQRLQDRVAAGAVQLEIYSAG